MRIVGAEREALQDIAKRLGITFMEQPSKRADDIKGLVRPAAGSRQFRAFSKTGRQKHGLCLHGQHAFMAHIFARFPEAVIETWYNTWNSPLFRAGAKAWTLNQQAEWATENTCDCTPEMVEEALRSPSEIMEVLI